MSLGLSIAGCGFRIHGSEDVADAVCRRFGAFVAEGPTDVEISVEGRRFEPQFEELMPMTLAWRGEVAVFDGMGHGEYHVRDRRGAIGDCGGMGAIDAMIRLALSAMLPERGALLLHGAALPGGVALCGDSGTGKSTASAALGGACDELIAVTAEDLCATPWWRGRPMRARLSRVLSLRRGGAERRALAGTRAVRELLSHAVRYLPTPDGDRALLGAAAAVCGRVKVEILDCPEGGAFLPFLMEQL
jgi:hypothetical protein